MTIIIHLNSIVEEIDVKHVAFIVLNNWTTNMY
jgi:hypothetical protein